MMKQNSEIFTNRDAALEVLKSLRDAGYTAYYAGGCVRDMLLGRTPKDYDIASSAHPDEVIQLFRRTVSVGAKFGVILVMVKDWQIEVATFRTDGGYSDGRRPDSIIFTEPKEDASRRDFTVNGMFYDPINDEVIDYVGGKADLERRIIRTIGAPFERFEEDYLRMLRAVRFSSELEFPIEEQTFEAIKKYAGKISNISVERVAVELEKVFASPSPAVGISLLIDSGLDGSIFKEKITKDDFGYRLLEYHSSPVSIEMGIMMLYADRPKRAVQFAKSLKLGNSQINTVLWCMDNAPILDNSQMPLHVLRPILADVRCRMLFEFKRITQLFMGQSLGNLEVINQRKDALAGDDLLPEPLVNGNEIIALGIVPGPRLGKICKKIYQMQLDNLLATKEQAIEQAKKLIESI